MIIALVSSALAGGYFFPDSGVVAVGRGGAFVASADDTFAQYYNPAALTRLDRYTVDLGVSGVSQGVSFERELEDGTFAPTVENAGGAFVVPQIGVGGPIGDDFAFAVGLYTGYAPSFSYPRDGAQRYTLSDSLIWQAFVGPSLAWKPNDQLSFGVGLQWQFLRVEQDLVVSTNGIDDPRGDVFVSVKEFDPFSPSANLGVLYEPVDEIDLGLSVQLPSSFNADGTLVADFTGSGLEQFLDDPTVEDDSVRLGIDLPLIVKAGVAVHPVEAATIEVAAVYERWSSLKSLQLSDVQLPVEFNNPAIPEPEVSETIDLPAGFRDVVSVRLGASVDATEFLTLRAGGFYESGSQRASQVSVALYDPWKVQFGGGASAHLLDRRLSFDLSTAYLAFPSLEVRDSTLEMINVQDGDTLVVGNGNYASSGFVLAGGISFAFGQSRGE